MNKVLVFLRKCLVVAMVTIIDRLWVYRAIGSVNRRLGVIRNVFLMYPASKKYADSYAFQWLQERMKFRFCLCGIYIQNGGVGLSFATMTSEDEFLDAEKLPRLRTMLNRLEDVRVLLAAPRKSFAGILPNILMRQGLVDHSIEEDVAVHALEKGLDYVSTVEGFCGSEPVLLLGGKGSLAGRIAEILFSGGRNSVIIDYQTESGRLRSLEVFRELSDSRALLVILSRKSSLKELFANLWPQVVVLNDVYPPPSRRDLEVLRGSNIHCYHLVGIRATVFPPFPHAYAGAIPCCAAWDDKEMDVIVKSLTRG